MYEDRYGEFDYIEADENLFAKIDYYDRYNDWSGSKLPESVYASVADYVSAGVY